MLPQFYEIWAVNNLGFDIDASSNSASEHLKVYLQPWKFGTSGALEYLASGSEVSLSVASDVADGGAVIVGAAQDNSTNLYLGFNGRVEISSDDTGHVGTVDLYMVGSSDGGTTYPSDHANFNVEEDGIPIGSLTFDHDGTGTDVKGANISYE